MTVLWASDLHLDYWRDPRDISKWGAQLKDTYDFSSLIISGDISTQKTIKRNLRLLQKSMPGVEIYFIPGNHDHYGGSIESARKTFQGLKRNGLTYLENQDYCQIEGFTTVGQYCWYDALRGAPFQTPVRLWDFTAVMDLQKVDPGDWAWEHLENSRHRLLSTLRGLALEGVDRFALRIEGALKTSKEILVVTHVPPFKESSWHQGQPSGPDWLPWMTCHTLGHRLLAIASANPDAKFAVLCGHTHSHGYFRAAENLHVYTGIGREQPYGATVTGILGPEIFNGTTPWELLWTQA